MPKRYNAPPDMQIDANKTYVAHFTTSRGEFDIQLFAKEVPDTVNNFVFLARDGFYDGLNVHRVIKSPPFMVQGGCPEGSGRGGPGYSWPDEAAALQLRHDRLANDVVGSKGAILATSRCFPLYPQ